jgi:hypothetical protein
VAADAYHAVEVFGADGYGSGCAVTPSLILTAKHLLGEGEEITVPVSVWGGGEGKAKLLWRAKDLDLALLRFTPPGGATGDATTAPVTVGRLPSWDESERQFALFGWPRAGAGHDPEEGWTRSPFEVVGAIRLAERKDEVSPIRLRPADKFPALEKGSWWDGTSGAAVFVGGALVGVQVEQPRVELPEFLAAQPLVGAHPDQLRLLELLAEDGVRAKVALGGLDAALRDHLTAVVEQLAAPPGWFPSRLRDSEGVVERLFQPPALGRREEEAEAPIAGLGDVPVGAGLVVLEGPAGSGKSWALAAHGRELATSALAQVESADDPFSKPLLAPAWCRLADIQPGGSAKEVLARAIAQMEGDPQLGGVERGLGTEIRWHLLVDGVDEASDEQKEALGQLVDRVLTGGGPVERIVVATRPGELEFRAGSPIERIQLGGIESRAQTALIETWFEDRPAQADAVRVLADNWRLREAFQTPLVLTLTCIVVEEWEDARPILRSSADVFRAAAATLLRNDHRSGGVKAMSATAQRAQKRATEALTTLASRLFTAQGYQPSLPAAAVADVDDAVLDACIDTGLVSLRTDGGVDFASRAIAAYLAAQHLAAQGGWEEALAGVWDSEAVAEVQTYVPHALTAPLLPTAEPIGVEPWFEAADRLAADGDPGFLLFHTACRALASIDPSAVPEARARYVQALSAHVRSGVDPRAADALASLAPEALAGLAATADLEDRFGLALILANVGHEDGFALLDDATLEALDDSTAMAVLEWLVRRGAAAGLRRVEQQAQAGASPYRRLVASLLLAHWEVDGAAELLAANLGREEVPPDRSHLAAALLAEEGDERGIEVLHELLDSSDPAEELRAMAWLPGDPPGAEERLTRLTDAALEADAGTATVEIGLAAGAALVGSDPERGHDYLARLGRLSWAEGDGFSDELAGPVLAAAVLLLDLDPETAIELLEEQAGGSSHRSLAAACLLLERDADRGAQPLLRLAADASAATRDRIAAARILELHGRSEATAALDSVKGVADEELKLTTGRSALDEATLGIAYALADLQARVASPREALENFVNGLRAIPDVRPSDGVWRDATEGLFTATDPESGTGPALFAQFDLDSEVDRRALAMTIPLIDDSPGRSYLATQAAISAPSDDWLLLMARWAVGDFSESLRDEHAVDSWVKPMERLREILPGAVEWAGIAWSDENWIVGRCLPLVLDHLTAAAFLEMAHRLQRPIHPTIARGLIGSDPIPGLSDPTIRACTGRACDEGMAHALADMSEPDAVATREALLARAEAVTCTHA